MNASTPAHSASSRTRWAGIIWGLVFVAVGAAGFRTAFDADVRAVASDWLWSQNPATLWLWGVLLVGALVTVGAVVGLAGTLQRRLRARRAPAAPVVVDTVLPTDSSSTSDAHPEHR